jgi:hypothetical protein
MRIDELKLGDDGFEALLARAVVDGGDRVMRLRGNARQRESCAEDAVSRAHSPLSYSAAAHGGDGREQAPGVGWPKAHE